MQRKTRTGPPQVASTLTLLATDWPALRRKAFEGPYKHMPRWVDEMETHVAERGKDIVKLYSGYTTCPRCTKAYGENYVVLYAQVAP